jgi:hypothetical protein
VFSTPDQAAEALRVALACEKALESGSWVDVGEVDRFSSR